MTGIWGIYPVFRLWLFSFCHPPSPAKKALNLKENNELLGQHDLNIARF